MGGDEHLELTDQPGVVAELQLGLEQLDSRSDVQLAQLPDLMPGRAFEDDVCERRPAPRSSA